MLASKVVEDAMAAFHLDMSPPTLDLAVASAQASQPCSHSPLLCPGGQLPKERAYTGGARLIALWWWSPLGDELMISDGHAHRDRPLPRMAVLL